MLGENINWCFFLQCLFKSTTLDGLIDFSRAVNI